MTIETVLSSVVVFVATSVDELVVLTTIFAYAERRGAVAQVYVGQLISQAVLLTISVLAAVGIETVSQKGIGLLGILPIVFGIRILRLKPRASCLPCLPCRRGPRACL